VTLNASPISVIVTPTSNLVAHTLIARLRLIYNGRHTLTRAYLKCILIRDTCITDYSIMRDVMIETCDLCISIICTSTSQLCLSHIVLGRVD
jgi:hypothetical protein